MNNIINFIGSKGGEEMQVTIEVGERDSTKTWREELRITNIKTAEEESRKIIEKFNNDLRPGEKPRKFIRVIEEKIKDGNSVEGFFELASRFRVRIAHEDSNLYSNAWCKAHYDQVDNLYTNLGVRGNLTRFKNLVHQSPYQREFKALIDSKLTLAGLKEEK